MSPSSPNPPHKHTSWLMRVNLKLAACWPTVSRVMGFGRVADKEADGGKGRSLVDIILRVRNDKRGCGWISVLAAGQDCNLLLSEE